QFTYIGPQLQFPIVWWILGLAAAITIALFIIGAIIGRDRYHEMNVFQFIAWIMAVLLGISGAGFAAGHIPFESKYWGVYSATGTVEAV
ncbi:hypothetical protein NL505_27885, partial [Klebsiella pneumoniae]|nr:hypothetical protein [Klebsiella pneumoniae]